MIYILGLVTTFVTVFGMEGRGSWSRIISNIGGILWLATIIYAFYIFSWWQGIFFLLGTFVLGAILQKVLRPILNAHGH